MPPSEKRKGLIELVIPLDSEKVNHFVASRDVVSFANYIKAVLIPHLVKLGFDSKTTLQLVAEGEALAKRNVPVPVRWQLSELENQGSTSAPKTRRPPITEDEVARFQRFLRSNRLTLQDITKA